MICLQGLLTSAHRLPAGQLSALTPLLAAFLTAIHQPQRALTLPPDVTPASSSPLSVPLRRGSFLCFAVGQSLTMSLLPSVAAQLRPVALLIPEERVIVAVRLTASGLGGDLASRLFTFWRQARAQLTVTPHDWSLRSLDRLLASVGSGGVEPLDAIHAEFDDALAGSPVDRQIMHGILGDLFSDAAHTLVQSPLVTEFERRVRGLFGDLRGPVSEREVAVAVALKRRLDESGGCPVGFSSSPASPLSPAMRRLGPPRADDDDDDKISVSFAPHRPAGPAIIPAHPRAGHPLFPAVIGPPGCGKSTAITAYARAGLARERVAWVYPDLMAPTECCAEIATLLADGTVGLVVIDGDLRRPWAVPLCDWLATRCCCCGGEGMVGGGDERQQAGGRAWRGRVVFECAAQLDEALAVMRYLWPIVMPAPPDGWTHLVDAWALAEQHRIAEEFSLCQRGHRHLVPTPRSPAESQALRLPDTLSRRLLAPVLSRLAPPSSANVEAVLALIQAQFTQSIRGRAVRAALADARGGNRGGSCSGGQQQQWEQAWGAAGRAVVYALGWGLAGGVMPGPERKAILDAVLAAARAEWCAFDCCDPGSGGSSDDDWLLQLVLVSWLFGIFVIGPGILVWSTETDHLDNGGSPQWRTHSYVRVRTWSMRNVVTSVDWYFWYFGGLFTDVLLAFNAAPRWDGDLFVDTPTTLALRHVIDLYAAVARPVLLYGPPGTGKTPSQPVPERRLVSLGNMAAAAAELRDAESGTTPSNHRRPHRPTSLVIIATAPSAASPADLISECPHLRRLMRHCGCVAMPPPSEADVVSELRAAVEGRLLGGVDAVTRFVRMLPEATFALARSLAPSFQPPISPPSHLAAQILALSLPSGPLPARLSHAQSRWLAGCVHVLMPRAAGGQAEAIGAQIVQAMPWPERDVDGAGGEVGYVCWCAVGIPRAEVQTHVEATCRGLLDDEMVRSLRSLGTDGRFLKGCRTHLRVGGLVVEYHVAIVVTRVFVHPELVDHVCHLVRVLGLRSGGHGFLVGPAGVGRSLSLRIACRLAGARYLAAPPHLASPEEAHRFIQKCHLHIFLTCPAGPAETRLVEPLRAQFPGLLARLVVERYEPWSPERLKEWGCCLLGPETVIPDWPGTLKGSGRESMLDLMAAMHAAAVAEAASPEALHQTAVPAASAGSFLVFVKRLLPLLGSRTRLLAAQETRLAPCLEVLSVAAKVVAHLRAELEHKEVGCHRIHEAAIVWHRHVRCEGRGPPAEVEHKKSELAGRQGETAELLRQIAAATDRLAAKRDQVITAKSMVLAATGRMRERREVAMRAFARAKPHLDDAETALNIIQPSDLVWLRRLLTPPELVRRLFDTVLILLRLPLVPTELAELDDAGRGSMMMMAEATAPRRVLKDSHVYARHMMADMNFVKELIELPRDAITDEQVELLMPYLEMEDFTYAKAQKCSGNVAALVNYVRATLTLQTRVRVPVSENPIFNILPAFELDQTIMGLIPKNDEDDNHRTTHLTTQLVLYHNMVRETRPQAIALKEAETRLRADQAGLAALVGELDQLQGELALLQGRFDEITGRREQVRELRGHCGDMMDTASTLLTLLADDQSAWTQHSLTTQLRLATLGPDTALLAATQTYCPPLPTPCRARLLTTWVDLMRRAGGGVYTRESPQEVWARLANEDSADDPEGGGGGGGGGEATGLGAGQMATSRWAVVVADPEGLFTTRLRDTDGSVGSPDDSNPALTSPAPSIDLGISRGDTSRPSTSPPTARPPTGSGLAAAASLRHSASSAQYLRPAVPTTTASQQGVHIVSADSPELAEVVLRALSSGGRLVVLCGGAGERAWRWLASGVVEELVRAARWVGRDGESRGAAPVVHLDGRSVAPSPGFRFYLHLSCPLHVAAHRLPASLYARALVLDNSSVSLRAEARHLLMTRILTAEAPTLLARRARVLAELAEQREVVRKAEDALLALLAQATPGQPPDDALTTRIVAAKQPLFEARIALQRLEGLRAEINMAIDVYMPLARRAVLLRRCAKLLPSLFGPLHQFPESRQSRALATCLHQAPASPFLAARIAALTRRLTADLFGAVARGLSADQRLVFGALVSLAIQCEGGTDDEGEEGRRQLATEAEAEMMKKTTKKNESQQQQENEERLETGEAWLAGWKQVFTTSGLGLGISPCPHEKGSLIPGLSDSLALRLLFDGPGSLAPLAAGSGGDPPGEWMDWRVVLQIGQTVPCLRMLPTLFQAATPRWRGWYQVENPEAARLPCGLEDSTPRFARLLLVLPETSALDRSAILAYRLGYRHNAYRLRALTSNFHSRNTAAPRTTTQIRLLRPDRALLALADYVRDTLGLRCLDPPLNPMLDALPEFTERQACLVLVPPEPAVDVAGQLAPIATSKGLDLRVVTLGTPASAAHALSCLRTAATSGGAWMLVLNADCDPEAIDRMDAVLEREPVHPAFRLWVTCAPSATYLASSTLCACAPRVRFDPGQSITSRLPGLLTALGPVLANPAPHPDWRALVFGATTLYAGVMQGIARRQQATFPPIRQLHHPAGDDDDDHQDDADGEGGQHNHDDDATTGGAVVVGLPRVCDLVDGLAWCQSNVTALAPTASPTASPPGPQDTFRLPWTLLGRVLSDVFMAGFGPGPARHHAHRLVKAWLGPQALEPQVAVSTLRSLRDYVDFGSCGPLALPLAPPLRLPPASGGLSLASLRPRLAALFSALPAPLPHVSAATAANKPISEKPPGTLAPLAWLLRCEAEAFNGRVDRIRHDLQSLMRCCDDPGRHLPVPGSRLAQLAAILGGGFCPSEWHHLPAQRGCCGSALGSDALLRDLAAVRAFLAPWVAAPNQLPASFDMSRLTRPRHFLAALKQQMARAPEFELHRGSKVTVRFLADGDSEIVVCFFHLRVGGLVVEYHVAIVVTRIPPPQGVYLSGLWLYEVAWDKREGRLVPLPAGREPYTPAPLAHLTLVTRTNTDPEPPQPPPPHLAQEDRLPCFVCQADEPALFHVEVSARSEGGLPVGSVFCGRPAATAGEAEAS
ncbi:putative Dyneins heavy chain [Paratrimastix pyriformis]|uniref:Dyneins heavy chain n=1 Tax=Paratrimastix pyriformis TaxID=342808 RepID=A0ABQ8UKT4_9EUKA|nr:putative Dyneins heavy chain [Paratrimastix pyriformis]